MWDEAFCQLPPSRARSVASRGACNGDLNMSRFLVGLVCSWMLVGCGGADHLNTVGRNASTLGQGENSAGQGPAEATAPQEATDEVDVSPEPGVDEATASP